MHEHIIPRVGVAGRSNSDASFMLNAIYAFDWGSTPAGDIGLWEAPLKHTLRLMLRATTPMALLLGREALLTYNDTMRELFGTFYDGSLARTLEDVLPEAAKLYHETIEQCFSGKACNFSDQAMLLCCDGEWKTAWFDLSFTPVMNDEDRVLAVLLIVSETTARVTTLQELQRTQKRLDVAFDVSGIVGTWDINVRTNRLTCDERFARLFGISPEDGRLEIDTDTFINIIHQDDREIVQSALKKSMQLGSDYHCRYRVYSPKYGLRWYLDAGRAILDDAGQVKKLTGIVIDLTSQVSVETAFHESEARFRAFVESIPQIVWGTDGQGRHDYFNGRWTEFTGLDPNAVADDEWQRLVHPDDWPMVAETWEECLRTGKTYDIEYRFRHWSEEYRWLRVMALPLYDRSGHIIRWYGTSTDIEDQKRLVDERELIANELEHRIRNIFALVNGLVALSVREHPDLAPIAEDFQKRLSALYRAHSVIRARDKTSPVPVSIQSLVRKLLEPYDDGTKRISVSGDDVHLKETMLTPLALVFHELASNAAKYGALTVPTGLLHLCFKHDGKRLHVCWKEMGLQATADIPESGYGSRLLALTIEWQLKGSYSKTLVPNELIFEFIIPIPPLS